MSLTPKQLELLLFIQRYTDEHGGVSPTFRECSDAVGLRSTNGASRLLTGLEERGFIRRLRHRTRSITILKRVKVLEDDARAAYKQTLQEIAAGDGVYGAQAHEYKQKARKVLERFP